MKVSGIKEFLLEKFTSKKAALMEWQSSVPVSYRMYIYGIAIPLPLAIIAFIFFPKHINGAGLFFVSIMAILLIIGFLLDFIAFFRKIYKTWLGKLVYSILAYVAYLFAEFYSKTIIYDITATNPELYSTAINIFILIFILPSWLFLIMVFFMVIIIILFILSIVTLPIDMFLKSMFGSSYFPEKLNFLLKNIKRNRPIQNKNI